jgi:hypothetical protein
MRVSLRFATFGVWSGFGAVVEVVGPPVTVVEVFVADLAAELLPEPPPQAADNVKTRNSDAPGMMRRAGMIVPPSLAEIDVPHATGQPDSVLRNALRKPRNSAADGYRDHIPVPELGRHR